MKIDEREWVKIHVHVKRERNVQHSVCDVHVNV